MEGTYRRKFSGSNRHTSVAVAAAVNDPDVLRDNLAASPLLVKKNIPLIIKQGYQSAARAYNAALDHVAADVVIFAHQDVYLPQGWGKKLLLTVQWLELHGKNWGVLGVVGKDTADNLVGGAWSGGQHSKIETEFSNPMPIVSIDEVVIVVRKDSGLRFDIDLPGFHLYGTDIVQLALDAGLEAYVFDGPVVHNHPWRTKSGWSYARAYRYMQRKWWKKLPIYTTGPTITRSGSPILRNWYGEIKMHIIRKFRPIPATWRKRHPHPSRIAANMGYEDQE